MSPSSRITPNDRATADLVATCRSELVGAENALKGRSAIARHFGALLDGDTCRFGFRAPDLLNARRPSPASVASAGNSRPARPRSVTTISGAR